MRLIQLWAAILATLSLFGCEKPEPPQVTAQAVRVSAVGPNALELIVELRVYNPNSFELSAQSVDGAMVLSNGQELGRGRAAPDRPIPAKKTETVVSTLSVPWTSLSALLPLAASDQPIPYKFIGSARIGGKHLNVNVPFELTGALTRAQLLEIGMRGLMPPGTAPQP